MALLLAVLTTAVRADVVPFTESYNAESTTDGWTSSVAGRFTPMIYNEADFQQGASDNYFLSVNQSERYNNGCVVTGTILSGKAAAGDDFTLEFDMRLCNSSGSGSQSPVSLQIKDADNDKDIFALSAPEKYAPTWDVNGTDLQVTLPDYGGQSISALTWCHYVIARSGNLTYLTITNNSTQETILERTLIRGSSETGGLGNIVFTTKRYYANFAIDNIVVRALEDSDVPSVAMSSYTIKYRNESGDEIAADIVTPYIVSGEATANDGQLAPIYYNDKKYLYKEGNSTITLVGDAAQNVITLVYREAPKCSYTVKALYGGKEKVLLEGSGFEGDVVTYNYPEYILDGTTLYLKNRNTTNPYFGNTITLSETSITEYVEYADGMAEGVVFYKEAEQMDGFTPLTTNNADIRCSDGKGGIIEGDDPVVLTTLPAGTYTIYGQIWGTAGYTATITAGEQTVWELETPGYLSDATTELTLTEETTLYIKDSGDLDGKRMLDLIYIQESKPHYIAEYNLDQATLTFKQGTLPLGSSIVWDAENTGSEPGWLSNNSRVRTVVFDESFADARPTSCALWFRGASTLTTIVGLEYLNTSEATSMAEMFRNCQQLTTLDLSTFDTKNVTDMNYMFYNDKGLKSLNVSSFNTSKVENMSYMFGFCSALQSLDVSGFNTSEVKSMPAMFMSCLNLTQLDMSNFNTSKVTDMLGVFFNCASLTSLDLSSFNTSNVERMASMFYDCSSLKTINVGEGWNTSAVTNSAYMFSDCSALVGGAGTAYDVEHTDAEYARIDGGADAPGYFAGKNATPVVNPEAYAVLSEDGQTVTFYYDTQKANRAGVVEINQSYIDTDKGQLNAYGTATTAVIDASFADYRPTSTACWFCGCSNLASLDLSNFNTSNVTDMSLMFYGCRSLKTIFIGDGWTTDAVTEGYYMFYNCTALVGSEGTLYHDDHIDAEYARIDGVSYLPGYLTDKRVSSTDNPKAYAVLSDDGQTVTFYYDTQKANRTGVVEINRNYIMPENDVHSAYGTATSAVFDASFADYHPINTAFWFDECSKLTSISGIEFINTEYVVDMQGMFLNCKSLKVLDLSHFNTSKVQCLRAMFNGCNELTSVNLSSFNTSNVKNMRGMFNYCYQLTELDLSNFNASNVTEMNSMFCNCTSLKSVNLANFKTLQVKWTEAMFANCISLTELDLSSFETPNLTYVVGMFQNCSSLKTIYVGKGWSSERVTHSGYMFSNCTALVGGAGTVFDANHTDAGYARIDGGADAPGYFTAKNVTPKDNVTLAAKSYSRQYGEENPAFEYDVTEGTITDGTPELSSGATAASPVGTYDIVISKGSVTNNEVSLVNGTLTITKAPLTISCGDYTIMQGEVLPEFALEYNGWKNDETEDVLTTKPTVTCEASKDSEPGTYDIIVSGAEAQNYEISYVAGKLTVTARKDNVTLTAKSYTREYGEANPAFEYDVTEGTITDGAPKLATEATVTSPVGTYDIVISKGSVSNNEVSLVNGTLTITKAPLTISCGDYTIMQGEALPYFAPMYDGWKNGETEKVLTQRPTVWCVARQDSEPGTYDIIVRDAEAENYEISYVAGTLTITAKPIVIEPVEVETEMKTEALSGQDLSNNVVNDVYYNVSSDSYDASDKSIVISQTTNMTQIADKQPGSKDVKENFNGMILKVAKGKGLITVNVKTSGNAQLVVQVGNGTPMLASKTEKGDVVFRYDVEEDTYVYIYAIIGSSAAKGYGINAADTESSVRIYSITVSPGATGIRSIGASEKNGDNIYDLQGHRVETPAKGIYIIGGRKVAVK